MEVGRTALVQQLEQALQEERDEQKRQVDEVDALLAEATVGLSVAGKRKVLALIREAQANEALWSSSSPPSTSELERLVAFYRLGASDTVELDWSAPALKYIPSPDLAPAAAEAA